MNAIRTERSRRTPSVALYLGTIAALVVLGQKLAGDKTQSTSPDETAPISSTTAPETAPSTAAPSGNFVKVWVEHNMQRYGRRGIA